MKNLLTIVFALCCCSVQAQRWGREVAINYLYANPSGGMGELIDRSHGAGLQYAFVHPTQRFSFGVDFSYSQYGRDKSKQEYTFDDGTTAPMEIVVINSYINLMGYTRWYLRSEGLLRPYLVGKLGYSYYSTDLNIYDPDDRDHCEPVDKDVLYEDGTMIGVFGAGLKFDLAAIFRKLERGSFYLDANVNFMQGGDVTYMNTDAPPHHHHGPSHPDQVTADFINTQTQIVHKHHVGYLYHNPVQMTEVRVGFLFHISR